MKKWKIPVTWEVCGTIECEAPTLEEAMEYAEDKDGVIPLPTESDYVDGSWRLSYETDEAETVRECWNEGQTDEASTDNNSETRGDMR